MANLKEVLKDTLFCSIKAKRTPKMTACKKGSEWSKKDFLEFF